MNNSLFVACLFAFIGLVYISMGLYAVILGIKGKLKRHFFMMSLSLTLWSVLYSIQVSAPTLEIASICSRYSVFGWAISYALTLEFSFLLYSKNENLSSKLKTFIYLPCVLLVLGIAILKLDLFSISVVKTNLGYIANNISPFRILYSLFFVLLIIVNVYRWQKSVTNRELSKNIRIVLITLITTVVIALIVRLSNEIFYGKVYVEWTVIFLLVPIYVFFLCIIRNKVIREVSSSRGEILDDVNRDIMFKIVGYVYVLLGYFSLIVNHFIKYITVKEQFLITFFCVVAGIVLFFLTKIFKNVKVQYTIITFMYILTMVFFIKSYGHDMNLTLWAIFFCNMALTALFTDAIYSLFTYTFMIFLQLYYWYNVPSKMVLFEWKDYFGRIVLVTIFSIFILYINYIYRKKVKDSYNQFTKQEVLNKISIELVDINLENSVSKLSKLLNDFNDGFDFIRSYYVLYDQDNDKLDHCIYCENGEVLLDKVYVELIFAVNPYWFKEVSNGNIIEILDINDDTECSEDIKIKFKLRGITGFYAVPIVKKDGLIRILVFEFCINEQNKIMSQYLNILKTLFISTVNKISNERELFYKANYDEVTGLMSKSLFVKEVNKFLEKSTRSSYVLYIDIDNFRFINDTFGHYIGDKVLKYIGYTLKNLGIYETKVTRFSDDEFVIFIKDISDKDKIKKYINQVFFEFENGISIEKYTFRIGITMGVSKFPEEGMSIEELIRNADIAMGEAKKVNFLKYKFYGDIDKDKVLEETRYLGKLYDALKNDEFVLYYQPQLCLESGKLIGSEALIRWNSKEFGLVPPNKFIPILERTGLIIDVGKWVIEEAIRQQAKLKKMGLAPIRMSINLSAIQFLNATLVDNINKIVKKYDVDTKFIEFEITESVAINDINFVQDAFNKIKKGGFSIAIDDFGTGYSSLNRLQNLPIDRLKIDKTFVDGIGLKDKRESIVNVIIELSNLLNVSSIAEGVEHKHQINYLKYNGCKEIQGYYFAKPMKSEDFEEFIKLNV